MGISYEDKDAVERLLAMIAERPALAPRCPTIVPRSIWASRATGRRGRVLWASGAQVCLSFDETNPKAEKVHLRHDFLRLYVEA